MSHHVMNCYKQLPIAFTHGQGVWLYDEAGNSYLDAITGIAVTGLGHSHPAVVNAIQEQAQKLLHTSNLYHIPFQEQLADELTTITQMDRAFFCNSGAEANEAALKLARLYGHHKDIDNPEVIVMEGAFHGRTLATLSASGSRKVQAGFEPLVRGFVRAPYNDVTAIETIAEHSVSHGKEAIVALMVEPVQGEGGVVVPKPGYLKELRRICDTRGWLLIIDEVQTGMGRTGSFYAYQAEQILPDIVTTAKGLGNGIPIGACLARGPVAELFQPGNHGSTFGGNPLASRVGLTVVKTIQEQKLFNNAKQRGEQLLFSLQTALRDCNMMVDIRGCGLMIGIELDHPCRDVMLHGLKHGVLFNVTAEKVVRLLPPLIISETETQEISKRVVAAINSYMLEVNSFNNQGGAL